MASARETFGKAFGDGLFKEIGDPWPNPQTLLGQEINFNFQDPSSLKGRSLTGTIGSVIIQCLNASIHIKIGVCGVRGWLGDLDLTHSLDHPGEWIADTKYNLSGVKRLSGRIAARR